MEIQLTLEAYITDAIVAKYASDICFREQMSLGKYVWGHTFHCNRVLTN